MITNFELLEDIFWYKGRPCKVYKPILYLNKNEFIVEEFVWIKYITDPIDVSLILLKDLEMGNGDAEKILYGE